MPSIQHGNVELGTGNGGTDQLCGEGVSGVPTAPAVRRGTVLDLSG